MELKPGMPADAVILTGPDTNTQSQTLDRQGTNAPSRNPNIAPVTKVPKKSMTLVATEVSDARN
jgi:hypothetical protein